MITAQLYWRTREGKKKIKPIGEELLFRAPYKALLHFASSIAKISSSERMMPVNASGIEVPTSVPAITFGYLETWHYDGASHEMSLLRLFESVQLRQTHIGRQFGPNCQAFKITLVNLAGLTIADDKDLEALIKMPFEILAMVIDKAVTNSTTFKDAAMAIAKESVNIRI